MLGSALCPVPDLEAVAVTEDRFEKDVEGLTAPLFRTDLATGRKGEERRRGAKLARADCGKYGANQIQMHSLLMVVVVVVVVVVVARGRVGGARVSVNKTWLAWARYATASTESLAAAE